LILAKSALLRNVAVAADLKFKNISGEKNG